MSMRVKTASKLFVVFACFVAVLCAMHVQTAYAAGPDVGVTVSKKLAGETLVKADYDKEFTFRLDLIIKDDSSTFNPANAAFSFVKYAFTSGDDSEWPEEVASGSLDVKLEQTDSDHQYACTYQFTLKGGEENTLYIEGFDNCKGFSFTLTELEDADYAPSSSWKYAKGEKDVSGGSSSTNVLNGSVTTWNKVGVFVADIDVANTKIPVRVEPANISLSASKQVLDIADNNADVVSDYNEGFEFTLTSDPVLEDLPCTIKNNASGAVSFGSFEINESLFSANDAFVNNERSKTLRFTATEVAGTDANILYDTQPLSKTYTVVETREILPDGQKRTIQVSDEDGNVLTSGNLGTFTNKKVSYGNIVINKKLAGNAADASKEFSFTVSAKNPDGSALADGTYEDAVFKNGKATIVITGEGSASIMGLPHGTIFEIEEADYSAEGYDAVTWDATPSGTIIGAIPNSSITFTATNTKNKEEIPEDKNLQEKAPKLSVKKTAGVTTAQVGDIVAYTITVANSGDADANGIEVVDTLPVGLIYVSDDAGGSTNGQDVAWTVDVAAGSTIAIILNTRITEDAVGKIINKVKIIGGDEGETGEYEDDVSIEVKQTANTGKTEDENSSSQNTSSSKTKTKAPQRSSDGTMIATQTVRTSDSAPMVSLAALIFASGVGLLLSFHSLRVRSKNE